MVSVSSLELEEKEMTANRKESIENKKYSETPLKRISRDWLISYSFLKFSLLPICK